jgi:thiamine-phosphate pyrophosphorylase
VTDRFIARQHTIYDITQAAIKGGVTMVQLREKHVTDEQMIEIGKPLIEITRAAGIPLIVNDRIDVALALDADGVHVGQQDMVAEQARAKIGPDRILGVSAETVAQAIRAEQAGADYIGAADVYGTTSKSDVNPPIGVEGLTEIVQAVSIPVVGIGGIKLTNADEVMMSGIAGIAVISAIMGDEDPEDAARLLRGLIDKGRTHKEKGI